MSYEGSVRDLAVRCEFFRLRLKGESLAGLYKALYELYNQFYFDGELKRPLLKITNHRPTVPWASYHFPETYHDVESISLHEDQYEAGYESFRDTLLHEMCRQYQRSVLGDKSKHSHSRIWHMQAERLGLQITVEHVEKLKNYG